MANVHYALNPITGEYLLGQWQSIAAVEEFAQHLKQLSVPHSDAWVVATMTIADTVAINWRNTWDINSSNAIAQYNATQSAKQQAQYPTAEAKIAETPKPPEPPKVENTGNAWEEAAKEEIGHKTQLLEQYRKQLADCETKLKTPNLESSTHGTQTKIKEHLEIEIKVVENRIRYLESQMLKPQPQEQEQEAVSESESELGTGEDDKPVVSTTPPPVNTTLKTLSLGGNKK